jgi:hypothetical protein
MLRIITEKYCFSSKPTENLIPGMPGSEKVGTTPLTSAIHLPLI